MAVSPIQIRVEALDAASGVLSQINQSLTKLVGSFIGAASQVEDFSNAFTALTGSAETSANIMVRIRELARGVGVTFEGAAQSIQSLTAVKVPLEDIYAGITEVGNALVLSGRSANEASGFFFRFSQIIGRTKLEQGDLNILLERIPLLRNVYEEAFGLVTAENINAQLASTNRTMTDFFNLSIKGLSQLDRAPLDSFSNAADVLKDSLAEAAAELGEHLLPAAVKIVEAITRLVDWFSQLPDPIQKVIAVVTAVTAGITALGVAAGAATIAIGGLNIALKGLGVASVAAGLTKLVGAFTSLAGVLPAAAAGLAVIASALGIAVAAYKDLTYETNRNTDALVENLTKIGNTQGIDALTAALKPLRQEYVDLLEQLNISEPDIQIPELKETPFSQFSGSETREAVDRLIVLYDLLEKIGPVLKGLRDGTNIDPSGLTKTADAAQNLFEQLVRARDSLERARTLFSVADTVDEVDRARDATISALEETARAEIAQIQQTIAERKKANDLTEQDEQELNSKILELQLQLQRNISSIQERASSRRTTITENHLREQQRLQKETTDNYQKEQEERTRLAEKAAKDRAALENVIGSARVRLAEKDLSSAETPEAIRAAGEKLIQEEKRLAEARFQAATGDLSRQTDIAIRFKEREAEIREDINQRIIDNEKDVTDKIIEENKVRARAREESLRATQNRSAAYLQDEVANTREAFRDILNEDKATRDQRLQALDSYKAALARQAQFEVQTARESGRDRRDIEAETIKVMGDLKRQLGNLDQQFYDDQVSRAKAAGKQIQEAFNDIMSMDSRTVDADFLGLDKRSIKKISKTLGDIPMALSKGFAKAFSRIPQESRKLQRELKKLTKERIKDVRRNELFSEREKRKEIIRLKKEEAREIRRIHEDTADKQKEAFKSVVAEFLEGVDRQIKAELALRAARLLTATILGEQTQQNPKKLIGSVVGNVAGAVIGSLVAPGVGTSIGSTVGTGIGSFIGGLFHDPSNDRIVELAAARVRRQPVAQMRAQNRKSSEDFVTAYQKGVERTEGSISTPDISAMNGTMTKLMEQVDNIKAQVDDFEQEIVINNNLNVQDRTVQKFTNRQKIIRRQRRSTTTR